MKIHLKHLLRRILSHIMHPIFNLPRVGLCVTVCVSPSGKWFMHYIPYEILRNLWKLKPVSEREALLLHLTHIRVSVFACVCMCMSLFVVNKAGKWYFPKKCSRPLVYYVMYEKKKHLFKITSHNVGTLKYGVWSKCEGFGLLRAFNVMWCVALQIFTTRSILSKYR